VDGHAAAHLVRHPTVTRGIGLVELALTFSLGVLILRFGLLLAGVLFCWFGYRL